MLRHECHYLVEIVCGGYAWKLSPWWWPCRKLWPFLLRLSHHAVLEIPYFAVDPIHIVPFLDENNNNNSVAIVILSVPIQVVRVVVVVAAVAAAAAVVPVPLGLRLQQHPRW